MTSQYHGGWVTDSQAIGSTPNQPSTVLASPNRTPEKIDIFQISDATTYEQAVGRKNTDRKNARANRARFTSSARPSDSAKVVGTMNAREDDEGEQAATGTPGPDSMSSVVAEADELGRGDGVAGVEEAEHRLLQRIGM